MKEELSDLQNRLFDLSARNPFIQVKPDKLWDSVTSSGKSLQALWKEAQFYKKEYDLETTLEIHLFLKWKEPHREEFFLSPLLYKPVNIKRSRKIDTEFQVVSAADNYQSNSILVHSFSRFFDIDLPSESESLESFVELLKDQLETKNTKIKTYQDFNDNQEWQIIEKRTVGNFNYKKSLLGKDYDGIISDPSAEVARLLGTHSRNTTSHIQDTNPIVPLDFSQKKALEYSNIGDLVIQGPPGTGKSHTIVALIGNYLAAGQKVLFVSQKKSALEVVYERLKLLELDHLTAFLNTEKNEKKEFFSDLRKTWEVMSQPLNSTFNQVLPLKSPLKDYYFHTYQRENEKLHNSLHEVVLELLEMQHPLHELEYAGTLPPLKDWKKNYSFLEEFETHLIKNHNIENLYAAPFIQLNKSVFTEKDPASVLDQRLGEMSDILTKIQLEMDSIGIESNIKEFTQICLAASILGMVNKSQLELLDLESKSYKAFANAAKKYQLLQTKVERAKQATANWKNKPTKTEITELIDLLKHNHAPKGIWGILKRRNERLLHAFRDFDRDLSDVAKLQLLEELRSEWNLVTQLEEVEIKLRHTFNLKDPRTEVNHILQVRHKLNSISQSAYLTILEQEKSEEVVQRLGSVHPDIQKLNSLARFIFHKDVLTSPQEVQQIIHGLKSHLSVFKLIAPELQKFFMIPVAVREFIAERPITLSKLNAIIKYNSLLEQSRFDLEFSKLTGDNLRDELLQIEKGEEENFRSIVANIKHQFHETIRSYEDLLATPASKLKGDLKEVKKELKLAKRMLIHELGKKQRHMPIKQFSASNWSYLSALQPLWMMNPLAVSERLNCSTDMFDVVIFDEASQIPLEDALPSIQRAKKVIVVGDSKQMPPGNFFSNATASQTLLDRAANTYNAVMLKWHYRSEHPALINFSNLHFYEGELLTPPPVSQNYPLSLINSKGTFHGQRNKVEAELIANHVSKLRSKQLAELAIISFSKEQENAIHEALAKKKINTSEILIRNLENVQGIERDNVFISIGYGPDEEGKFRLNFGPVNQESGSNRLNVLFTRAKKNITVFSSVTSEDFGLSDNLGVSCLKDYLAYVATEELSSFRELPDFLPRIENVVLVDHQTGSCIRAFIQFESSKILLLDPCSTTREVKDLKTLFSFLRFRFKEVKIMLSIDRLNNPERFNKEFEGFFKTK